MAHTPEPGRRGATARTGRCRRCAAGQCRQGTRAPPAARQTAGPTCGLSCPARTPAEAVAESERPRRQETCGSAGKDRFLRRLRDHGVHLQRQARGRQSSDEQGVDALPPMLPSGLRRGPGAPRRSRSGGASFEGTARPCGGQARDLGFGSGAGLAVGAPRARGAGGRSRQAQAPEAGTCPARRPEARPRGFHRPLGRLHCKAPSRCGGAELGGKEDLQGHSRTSAAGKSASFPAPRAARRLRLRSWTW